MGLPVPHGQMVSRTASDHEKSASAKKGVKLEVRRQPRFSAQNRLGHTFVATATRIYTSDTANELIRSPGSWRRWFGVRYFNAELESDLSGRWTASPGDMFDMPYTLSHTPGILDAMFHMPYPICHISYTTSHIRYPMERLPKPNRSSSRMED